MKCLHSVLVTPRFLYWHFHLMIAVTIFLFLIAFSGWLFAFLAFGFHFDGSVKEYHSSAFN